MKRHNLRIYIKLVTTAVILASISFFAWGNLYVSNSKPSANPGVRPSSTDVHLNYDTRLLLKLKAVGAKLDASGNEFFLSGNINITDGADSSQNIVGANYTLSKKGQNFYCMLGNTETINTDQVYVFADHLAKRILIGEPKMISGSQGMPELPLLIKNLEAEGYSLNQSVQGQTETISVVNGHHISCKQYSISFESNLMQPQQIYTRLTNPLDPEDSGKDKVIKIDISHCGQYSQDNRYETERFVKKAGATWTLCAAYEKYELIVL